MKIKIVNNYIYEGLGFPVELKKVEMISIAGDWAPKINVKKVADEVIEKLATQDARLTGNQVKFIRSYFSMSLREFGEKVAHESHMAVSKWEKKGAIPTNMNANTEHELRLYIMERKIASSKASKPKFFDIYLATKRFFNHNSDASSIIHLAA
jgi:DNA-binding transcriptional regulator YiaG